MKDKPELSVLVPFFGNFDRRRLELAMASVRAQSEKGIEFLICTGRKAINCDINSLSFDTEGVLSIFGSGNSNLPQDMPRGAIYNQGIKVARGEYLYISDSDIVFPNRFFEELIETAKTLNTPLQRPMMRRLLLPDFEQFYTMASSRGIEESLNALDFSQEFVVKLDKNPRDLRVFRKWENGRMKTFVITDEDFIEYSSNPENKGAEPKFFNQERHCGSTFARKKEFEYIGGCCEKFISWGCWDADLQWKLKEIYGISYMSGEVIHLDHNKGYFNKDRWKVDRKFQERRRARGANQCITDDKGGYL